MCIGGSRAVVQPKPTFRDAPPIVTGSQTGVANPKDTKKATEELKIKRQKREGTYIDPNLSMLEDSLTRTSGLGAKARSERSARLRSGVSRGPKAPSKAQKMAAARRAKKSRR